MASGRLPSGERFESRILGELVPRTLKEGGYLLEKEGETDAELLSRACTHGWWSRRGETGTATRTVWTEKGRLFIHRLFCGQSLF